MVFTVDISQRCLRRLSGTGIVPHRASDEALFQRPQTFLLELRGEERLDLAGQTDAGVQFWGVTDLRGAGDGLHEILGLEGGMGPAHASHHPSGEPIDTLLEVNSLRSVVLHEKTIQTNRYKCKFHIGAMKASIGKPRRFRTAADRYRNRGLRPLFQREKVAESTGLEPATSAVTGRRSNQLS